MFEHLGILLVDPSELSEIQLGLALGVSHGHCGPQHMLIAACFAWPFSCVPFPSVRTANLLFPGAPSAAGCQRAARRRKFFNDVNAVIALVSGMCAPCQARGEELGFYSEQCLCVPFTQKKQRKLESFPQHLSNPQI